MPFSHQQFTYYGAKDAETFLVDVLTKIRTLFKEHFSDEQTAALILIGGYGRGEGGVVNKNGIYRPHNNLDLLYIHNETLDKKMLKSVDEALQNISKEYDIGIDLSAVTKKKLLTLEGLVISYDMRFGHKTLLGDSSFIQEHGNFSVYNIDPVDIRQLLVNRGTLLLINTLLLQKEELSTKEKKLIIKHAIKAIIGYGDALLFFHNQYHWSYAKKQSNMTKLSAIDEKTKALYTEAIAFRFKPDYETYLQKDLHRWNKELLKTLGEIHLECEKINLAKRNLSWDDYFDVSLLKKSYPAKNMKQKVKSILEGLQHPKVILKLASPLKIFSFLQLGNRAILSLLFPYVAYGDYPLHYRELFTLLLQNKDSTNAEFLRTFLLQWAKWGDTNFKNVLNSYHITLEKK